LLILALAISKNKKLTKDIHHVNDGWISIIPNVEQLMMVGGRTPNDKEDPSSIVGLISVEIL
jgi:hypothetical protein